MRQVVILLLILAGYAAGAQINVVPFVGINSTRMKDSSSYNNGGNYGLAGFELELRKKPKKHQPFYPTIMVGANYLKNGFTYSYNFAFSSFYYDRIITEIKSEYVQVPVMLRLNVQPFPLVEDLHFFFGGGITTNILIKSHLSEEYTNVFISEDLLAPPVTTHYEDSEDVTDLEEKTSLFQRYEIGMHYKRIQVAFRLSISISDLYYQGLEDTWQVPDENSTYISTYQKNGEIKEKYAELIVGFRIFK